MESFRCSLTPFLLIIWLTCCRLYKWTSIPWQWPSSLRQTQLLVSCYGVKLYALEPYSCRCISRMTCWYRSWTVHCVCMCVSVHACCTWVCVVGWLVCKQISIVRRIWLPHCYWSLLYGTVLCSQADSLCSCDWVTVAFYSVFFKYPPKWHT